MEVADIKRTFELALCTEARCRGMVVKMWDDLWAVDQSLRIKRGEGLLAVVDSAITSGTFDTALQEYQLHHPQTGGLMLAMADREELVREPTKQETAQ